MIRSTVFAACVAAITLSFACYDPPTIPDGRGCAEGGLCPDGQECDRDNICRFEGSGVDAGLDGPGEMPLDCEPDSIVCDADVLTECNAAGDGAIVTDCPAGCHDSEERCFRIVPSNGLGVFFEQAAAVGDVTIPSGTTFGSNGTVLDSTGEPIEISSELVEGVRVFLARNLTFEGGATLDAKRTAFVAAGPVVVRGTVLVSPSGEANCLAQITPAQGQLSGTAGGTLGGEGGNGGASKDNPPSQSKNPAPVSFEPLRAGCFGGDVMPGLRQQLGRGGGAVQIVSSHSINADGGRVLANGAGGGGLPGQDNPLGEDFGGVGAGGGSGGMILLEAPTVSFSNTAGVAANGGGGGCANAPGEGGAFGVAGAPGGGCAGVSAGSGGSGGSAGQAAGAGENGVAIGGGGGGGGGVGLIGVRSIDVLQTDASTVFSPPVVQSVLAVD